MREASAPTRRALLRRAAPAAAGLVLVPSAAVAAASDPHPAWAAEAAARLAEVEALPDHPATDEPLYAHVYALWELIAATPARTPAGVAAQVRLALDRHREGSTLSPCEESALDNALAALDRLAGETRRA